MTNLPEYTVADFTRVITKSRGIDKDIRSTIHRRIVKVLRDTEGRKLNTTEWKETVLPGLGQLSMEYNIHPNRSPEDPLLRSLARQVPHPPSSRHVGVFSQLVRESEDEEVD
jgi:hypothetical protein